MSALSALFREVPKASPNNMSSGRSTQIRKHLELVLQHLRATNSPEGADQVLRMHNALAWFRPWQFARCPYTGTVYAFRAGRTGVRYVFPASLTASQQRLVAQHYPDQPQPLTTA